MGTKFDLSVIIPTFNRKLLVTKAVESVLVQLDQNEIPTAEILVVDDGSTDGTVEALQDQFQQKIQAGFLQILTKPPQADPAAARNFGVRVSKGDFVAFLDSDDYWTPVRLQKLAGYLKDFDLIFESPIQLPEKPDWIHLFLGMNVAVTSSIVVKKSLFIETGYFSERYYGPARKILRGWEDYECWFNCMLQLKSQNKLDRIHGSSLTTVNFNPQEGGAGRVSIREQMRREAMTLLKVSPRIPPKYWPILGRRLAGAFLAVAKSTAVVR